LCTLPLHFGLNPTRVSPRRSRYGVDAIGASDLWSSSVPCDGKDVIAYVALGSSPHE
jgi:hypothetical protein